MKGKLTLSVLRVSNGLDPIIQALDFMRSPRSAHRTDTVSLTHAGKKTELTQAQIDLEALRAWSKLLPEISKANGKQAVAAVSIPQVILTLAVAEKRKAALEKVLGILEGSRCNVLVLNPGSATRMDALAQAIVPCSKVVSTLRTTITQIDELAKKEKADQDAWKKEVTDAKKQRRKPTIPKPIPSKARTSAELSVTLQPVFIVGASAEKVLFYPKDTLELPALGNPQGLEWWHFQHECAAKRPWGDLLKEIGFSQEVLQAPNVPATDSTFWGRGVDYDPENFPDASGGVGVTKEQIEDNFNEFKPWSWGFPKNPF